MSRNSQTSGKVVAAVSVATSILVSAFAPTWSAAAHDPPLLQQQGKVQIQGEVMEKAEIRQNKVTVPIEVFVQQRPAGVGNVGGFMQVNPPLATALGAELRWLTATVNPTPAQRRGLAVNGGQPVRQMSRPNNIAPPVINRRPNIGVDYRKIIHEAMQTAATQVLTLDQLDRYGKEIQRKLEARQKVVILNLVARIDEILTLSTDQREQLIAELLRADPNSASLPSIEVLTVSAVNTPSIPDKLILPILTDQQRKIWASESKVAFALSRVNNLQPDFPAEDEDPDLKAALAGDPKP